MSVNSDTAGSSVDVVRELDPRLIAEWDELAETTDAPPWSRPGWFEIWQQLFAEGPPVVFCSKQNGKLIGVLPMVEDGRGFRAPVGSFLCAIGRS